MDEMIEAFIEIGKENTCITKIYLFGSRIRGDFGENSDIDIALEFEWQKGMGVGPLCSIWPSLSERLLPLFREKSPYLVDLQWYEGEQESPTIHKGITECSRLIYQKA